MGACISKGDQQSKLRSEEIDRSLDEDNKRLKRECKILLLGAFFSYFSIFEGPHYCLKQAQESQGKAQSLNR